MYDTLKFSTEVNAAKEYVPTTELEKKLATKSFDDMQTSPELYVHWLLVTNPVRRGDILEALEKYIRANKNARDLEFFTGVLPEQLTLWQPLPVWPATTCRWPSP